MTYLLGHDSHAHQITSQTGCTGTITVPVDGEHDAAANVFGVWTAEYTDNSGLVGTKQHITQPRTRQAEHFRSQNGVMIIDKGSAQGARTVGEIQNGDWIGFNPYVLSGVTSFTARVSSAGAGGTISLRAGSPTGTLLGSATVPVTGSWDTFVNVTGTVSNPPSGTTTLYWVFTGGAGALYDLDSYTLASGSQPPVTNLALNKPATADSSCAANEGPEKAVNGSVSGGNPDKWCSLGASKWWRVDLGANQTVGRVVLRHAGAGGENAAWNTRDFDIQVSTNGTTWTTVASPRGNTSNVSTHLISPSVSTRYIRVNILTPTSNTDSAARIYEFEAYQS